MSEAFGIQKNIGIAFSGGGIRAVVFHAGMLKRFAERRLLENIRHISSVSGGSLFVGLVFHFSGYQWPSSERYLTEVLPQIKTLLTRKSLQKDSIKRLIVNPANWRYVFSRANIVSKSIEVSWGIQGTLSQLPGKPLWSINGTAAEDGRRFRFKGSEIGNYEMGYTDAAEFKIASAMAVSIAFPGGIGPLVLKTDDYKWYKKKAWNSPGPAVRVIPEFRKIHLYDGGMYDNSGIEPLFDVGTQNIKTDVANINFIVLSDAGAPFIRSSISNPFHPQRLIRIANIASDQVRSLRIRSFVNFLKQHPGQGMYIQIGSEPFTRIKQYKPQILEQARNDFHWLDHESIKAAALHKTHIDTITEHDFNLLLTHGYETSMWNELVFGGV